MSMSPRRILVVAMLFCIGVGGGYMLLGLWHRDSNPVASYAAEREERPAETSLPAREVLLNGTADLSYSETSPGSEFCRKLHSLSATDLVFLIEQISGQPISDRRKRHLIEQCAIALISTDPVRACGVMNALREGLKVDGLMQAAALRVLSHNRDEGIAQIQKIRNYHERVEAAAGAARLLGKEWNPESGAKGPAILKQLLPTTSDRGQLQREFFRSAYESRPDSFVKQLSQLSPAQFAALSEFDFIARMSSDWITGHDGDPKALVDSLNKDQRSTVLPAIIESLRTTEPGTALELADFLPPGSQKISAIGDAMQGLLEAHPESVANELTDLENSLVRNAVVGELARNAFVGSPEDAREVAASLGSEFLEERFWEEYSTERSASHPRDYLLDAESIPPSASRDRAVKSALLQFRNPEGRWSKLEFINAIADSEMRKMIGSVIAQSASGDSAASSVGGLYLESGLDAEFVEIIDAQRLPNAESGSD